MADIVPFAKPASAVPKESWASGTVRCMRCKHDWVAARQVPHDPLECPQCGCFTGMPKATFMPDPSDEAKLSMWSCSCGEIYFNVVVDVKGREGLLCVSCGDSKPVTT